MKRTYLALASASALLMAGCSPAEDTGALDAATPPPEGGTDVSVASADGADAETSAADLPEKLQDVSAASYSIDPTHAFLSATVMHNGLSEYTVDFTDFDASLDFDPASPESSSLTVTIDPLGLNVNYPGDYKEGHPDSDFESWQDALSKDARFLNGEAYPEITFTSTELNRTGDYTGTVTGDLTFLGVTKPVTLDVTYNGMANMSWYGERDIIGFDATTTLNRSDFGQTSLQNAISDEVTIEFSGEFIQDENTED